MDNLDALRKKLLKKAKEQVKEEYTKRDVHIIKAVNLLDDLDSTFNLLAEQIREWYSFHFPELAEIVKDNERYLRLIYEIGGRVEFGSAGFKKLGEFYDNEEGVKKIDGKAKTSIGSDIEKLDLDEIKLLALNALNLREERKCLDRYVESAMAREMPNFSALAGGVIGARMLSKAGSMKKLALMPASTIQVLGAEKALFMHLRMGAKCPKYGLLYAHPMVKAAKPWNKGKLARTLSGKLAIAARRDYFIKNESPQLKETEKGLEERAKEIDARAPKRRGHTMRVREMEVGGRGQAGAGGKEMLPEQEGGNEARGGSGARAGNAGSGWQARTGTGWQGRESGGGYGRPRTGGHDRAGGGGYGGARGNFGRQGRGGAGWKGKPTRYEPRGQHGSGGNYGRPRAAGFGGQDRGSKPEGSAAPREFGVKDTGTRNEAGTYARGRHGGIAMRGTHTTPREFGRRKGKFRNSAKPHGGGERHGAPHKKVLHKKEAGKGRRLH